MIDLLRRALFPIYRSNPFLSRSFPNRIHIVRSLHTPMIRSINTNIVLNETESQIRSLLVEFCDHYNQSVVDNLLELRITGGWVRDKLLGIESNDLDIAINHLSGEDFASRLFDYTQEKYPDLTLKAVHTIKKNPEKSKHLETCTTKLFGLDIDFVNLRSEAYTEDSRVPIIECGTAEEDALRRDATLNALFYNLNNNVIEDFTGRGLEDLTNGILRTPLQPLQTFLDDPLRVLRLIRFASRFDFTIEKDTLNAMINDDIHSTLIHKISRERVGVEVEKILTSKNPMYGLRLINFVGLTESIFNPGTMSSVIKEVNDAQTLKELKIGEKDVFEMIDLSTQMWISLQKKMDMSSFPRISNHFNSIITNKQLQKLFWLSIILLPYKDLQVRTNSKKPTLQLISNVILKEGLRFGKHDFDIVTNNIKLNVENYSTLEKVFRTPDSILRSELGLYLKECGEFVGLNLAFNCFNDLISSQQASVESKAETQPVPNPDADSIPDASQIESVLENYEKVCEVIETLGLENIPKVLIVDGKTLLKVLQRKPGPWLGKINEQVFIWQLNNPTGTAEECIEHVKEILPNYV
ncbi:CCA tRNA nucleotidyltransferase, mitochondrial [[Candida] railenensis]|uniref:CCA tRNA nucleotidyltransferase, mitochondrial n=1 Tax=[Candida] railenensis TaxID=45579 RepID=A0A9P0W020_9ASCO|nr:CCA tRNA nucleotidyltransferase, mitochondrial [[Candida] railenensis]